MSKGIRDKEVIQEELKANAEILLHNNVDFIILEVTFASFSVFT